MVQSTDRRLVVEKTFLDKIQAGLDHTSKTAAETLARARSLAFSATPLKDQDLNKLNVPGTYGIADAAASNVTNVPPGFTGGTLVVKTHSAQIFQTAYSYANGNGIFERTGTLASFFPWRETTADTNRFTPTPLRNVDLNTINVPGTYSLHPNDAATVTNKPEGWTSGPLVVYVNALQIYQETREYAGSRRKWDRQGTLSSFFGWTRADIAAAADLSEPEHRQTSGYKSAYLALNVSESSGTESNTSGSIRFPLNYGVGIKRARLHVRNWQPAASDGGTVYSGAVSFSGAWIGRASAGNQFSGGSATRVLPAFSTAANGDEYVSPWFSCDLTANTGHLLALGYTAPAGSTQARNRGGCWRTASAADAELTAGYTGTYSIYSPFDFWLEVETPAATPILCGLGDSNTAGTGTFYPVADSWLSQYCRTAGALPYFMAQHGATAASWNNGTAARWHRFDETIARPDAVVHFLGRNDIQDGVTLAQMQDRFSSVLNVVREHLSPHVYAATITPGNSESAEQRTLRRAYNSWLMTKPSGLHDVFDFSAAVSDDDTTIRESDNADGLHFRITGHAAIAAKLSERPVTPSVLSQEEVVKLKALAR